MAASDIAVSGLSETEHRGQLRRALIASTIGTTIEWYDFLLYSTVTGLVFAKTIFSGFRSVDRDVAGVRHFLHRLHRPAGGRRHLRTLWRPDRPQGDVDRNPGNNRSGDGRGGPGADLRADRHLGGTHHDCPAVYTGCRRRRRMGRFGVDVDGMGTDQRQSRFHRLLAAIRRSGGHCPCQSRCVGIQRAIPATSSWSGAGASRSSSASSWSGSGSTSGSASSKLRCSRSWWRKSASHPHPWWRY